MKLFLTSKLRWLKNTVINIEWSSLPSKNIPKVAHGAAKEQVKKNVLYRSTTFLLWVVVFLLILTMDYG